MPTWVDTVSGERVVAHPASLSGRRMAASDRYQLEPDDGPPAAEQDEQPDDGAGPAADEEDAPAPESHRPPRRRAKASTT